jgi:hypothetical protein
MLSFAFHSMSEKSIDYRIDLIQFIKQHVQIKTVSQEKYEQLESKLEFVLHELECLKQTIQAASKPMDVIASQAGKMLRMQAETKPFRTNKIIKG